MSKPDPFAAMRARVVAVLDTLPMEQRAVYVLSTLDGLDYEAISLRLGIPAAQVEACLATAIIAIEPAFRDGFTAH